MPYFVGGIAVLFILVLLAQAFAAADPHSLVRAFRYTVGAVLIAVGGILVLAERWGLALPLIAAGISALTVGRIGPLDLGGGRRTPGSASTVRSAFLEMRLDHDTGEMTGKVLGGAYGGRALDDIDAADLWKL
ncbi:MAG: molecular chaperone DnaJ, partial [Bauldia sp.]